MIKEITDIVLHFVENNTYPEHMPRNLQLEKSGTSQVAWHMLSSQLEISVNILRLHSTDFKAAG